MERVELLTIIVILMLTLKALFHGWGSIRKESIIPAKTAALRILLGIAER